MAGKRKISPEVWARWDEQSRRFRELYEQRLARIAALEAGEARRRARLHRLTLGLLGREPGQPTA